MNREIKFRAWSHDNGEMYHADHVYHFTLHEQAVVFKPYREGDDSLDHFCTDPSDWEKKIEVMQYTGLKDRNGVEIYEGDILRGFHYGEPIGTDQVVFEIGKFALKDTPADLISYTYALSEYQCEVIGNIYETPQLLSK